MAELTLTELKTACKESFDLRRDFDTEWKEVKRFQAPGRGCFDFGLNTPSKFTVRNKVVVNPIGQEAARTLISGIYSWLSSSVRPWFKLGLPKNHPLYGDRFIETELENRQRVIYEELALSNFYTQRHRGYGELVYFGNSCLFTSAANSGRSKLAFDSLVTGEYTVARNASDELDTVYRHLFYTPRKLVQQFGKERLPSEIADKAEKGGTKDTTFYSVIHAIYNAKFRDYPVTSVYFLYGKDRDTVLSKSGYHEFPATGVSWERMHPHEYGLGPGSEALTEVMRLQEMEKATSMAVHKEVDPPMLYASRLKGSVKSLPGSENFVANPKDQAYPLYAGGYNIQAAEVLINRVEERIQRVYLNDIFLTAMREPNASPLKAAEVFTREREGMFKIGPTVEAVCSGDLVPTIRRCYSILNRAGSFNPLPEDVEQQLEGIDVGITSNLALIQKAITAQPLEKLLSTVAAMMQFEPRARYKVDVFKTIDEAADIYGAPEAPLRSTEDAMRLAQQAEQAAQEKAEEERSAALQASQAQALQSQSVAAKNFSDAGTTLQENAGQALTGYL